MSINSLKHKKINRVDNTFTGAGFILIIMGIILAFVSTQIIGYWNEDVFFILLIIGFIIATAVALLLWPINSVFSILGQDDITHNIIRNMALGNEFSFLMTASETVNSMFGTIGLSPANFFICVALIGVGIGYKTRKVDKTTIISNFIVGCNVIKEYVLWFIIPLISISLIIALGIALFGKGQIGFLTLLITYLKYLVIIVLIPYAISILVAGVFCGTIISIVSIKNS